MIDKSHAEFLPGQVIDGRYRLLRPIGSGGMASVWEVVEVGRNETLAIKLLASGLVASEEARARFEREVRAVSRIESPFVVRVMGYGVADGAQPYMVLERLVGRDLDDLLSDKHSLGLDEVACIVRHVCGALAAAGRAGVIHRDIKSANIFVTGQGKETIAKLVDFGIARVDSEEEQARKLTRPDEILGTLEYISPEQLLGRGPVDGRADLYSLAVVAYRCLTGRVPYPGDTLGELLLALTRKQVPAPSSIVQGIPASVDAWMAKALDQDREARFQTPEEMADRLVIAVKSHQAQLAGTPAASAVPTATTVPASSQRVAPAAPPEPQGAFPELQAELPSWVNRPEAPASSWSRAPGGGSARPTRDATVLPSRSALVARRVAARIEQAVWRWTRGRSLGAVVDDAIMQVRVSFSEHRAIWTGIATVVVLTVVVVGVFLLLG